jgi:hypothetical protein
MLKRASVIPPRRVLEKVLIRGTTLLGQLRNHCAQPGRDKLHSDENMDVSKVNQSRSTFPPPRDCHAGYGTSSALAGNCAPHYAYLAESLKNDAAYAR